MSSEKDNKNSGLFKQYERIISIIGGFAGLLLLILNLVQAWETSPTKLTWISIAVGGFMLLSSLAWVAFSWKTIAKNRNRKHTKKMPLYSKKQRHFSRIALTVFTLFILGAGYDVNKRAKALDEKLVILITEIHELDGSSDGFSEQLIVQLREDFEEYDDIIIDTVSEKITEQQGAKYARELGKKHKADLVLWGWYNATNTKTLLTLHVENLSSLVSLPLEESVTQQLQSSITELDSFRLQQEVGQDFSELVLFIEGFAHYEAGRYQQSLFHFETISEESSIFVEAEMIFFFRGNNYLLLDEYDFAIESYTQAIQINPQYTNAYFNRGNAYVALKEYAKAIDNYSQTINTNPEDDIAYTSRGASYILLQELEMAIRDFSQAIMINSENAKAYLGRGMSYDRMGEYEKAYDDYLSALKYCKEMVSVCQVAQINLNVISEKIKE